MGKTPMTENEKIVYDAVRTLFNSVDQLDILNKKAVYLYLREITGLNTKQIVSQLNKMRRDMRRLKITGITVNFSVRGIYLYEEARKIY